MQKLILKSAVTGLLLLGSMGLAQAAGSVNSNYRSVSPMQGYTAQVSSDRLVSGRSTGYGNVWGTNMQLQEPAISPNGTPTLSDFAAHR